MNIILTIQFISLNVLFVTLQALLQIVTVLKDENPFPFIFRLRPPPVLPIVVFNVKIILDFCNYLFNNN